MGFWKILGCIAGGVVAVVAAPLVLPMAAAAGAAAAGAASAAAAAAASTAVGGAVIGAATTVAGAATTAGAAMASSAVGTAVAGAATTVAGAASTAGAALASTSVGSAVVGAATSAGSAVAATATAAGVTSGGVAAATFGSSMTYSGITTIEAFDNFDSAKRIIDKAKDEFKIAEKELNKAIKSANVKLQDYNIQKIEIYKNEVKNSLKVIEKIVNVKEISTDYFDSKKIDALFLPSDIRRMELGVNISTEIADKLRQGVSLMTATSGLTSQLVGQFGFASTGTALSSLSGAAAQRATLAALGGGSLASGGAGMVGGQIMLGGLTLVPTAILMSWQMESNSQKALTEACEYHAKVKKTTEQILVQKSVINDGIIPRIDELSSTIMNMKNTYSNVVFPKLQAAYDKNKKSDGTVDFSVCSENDKNTIALSAHYLKTMAKLMRIKVVDAKGNPNKSLSVMLNSINNDQTLKASVS